MVQEEHLSLVVGEELNFVEKELLVFLKLISLILDLLLILAVRLEMQVCLLVKLHLVWVLVEDY